MYFKFIGFFKARKIFTIYPKSHILKVSFFTKFTFLKFMFDKIHIFKMAFFFFFSKLTLSKSYLSHFFKPQFWQNSQLKNRNFKISFFDKNHDSSISTHYRIQLCICVLLFEKNLFTLFFIWTHTIFWSFGSNQKNDQSNSKHWIQGIIQDTIHNWPQRLKNQLKVSLFLLWNMRCQARLSGSSKHLTLAMHNVHHRFLSILLKYNLV